LLRRLDAEVDCRAKTGRRAPAIVIVIDGLGALRSALSPIERTDSARCLDRILQDGPAVGIVTCATTDGASSSALSAMVAARWAFDDPVTAGHHRSGTSTAGRVRIAECGLMAQIVFEPDALSTVPDWPDDGCPLPIEVLPDVVHADMLDDAAAGVRIEASPRTMPLLVGMAADDLEPASLHVPDGDHVFIGGGARTGTSTVLAQLVRSWRRLHPGAMVIEADRCFDPTSVGDCAANRGEPVLIAVDDADRVGDPSGQLAAIVASRLPGVTVIAAGRLDAVRVAYGHWVREVTRSRCGLIMTSAGEIDGELLGATLPRRSMIGARPGLAWMIEGRGHRLVQVAARMPS